MCEEVYTCFCKYCHTATHKFGREKNTEGSWVTSNNNNLTMHTLQFTLYVHIVLVESTRFS